MKRVKNNRDDNDDNNINNEKDLCLLFIESCESLCNLTFEIEKNTHLLLKRID